MVEQVHVGGSASQNDGELRVDGLDNAVIIRRDEFGIPHVEAQDEHDIWFGQGFVSAQDRLWQMEYDRLRATGRWSEAVGSNGVAADILARRLQLAAAARADVEAMSPETRAMFDAYARGVNAFLSSGQPLPVEYGLAGLTPEPWEAWHSVVSFKIRHVLMGPWQGKIAQAMLLAQIGPEAYAKLDGRPPEGSMVILPPGGAVGRLFRDSADELRLAAEHLGFLAEVQAGSNSWAVHGSRTTTGKPVLCNDSHRQLDVPNVYWQIHLTCPSFSVIGATFPGVPGFPHFGHNGRVGWNITHASADYQDLYVEQFDRADPARYRTPQGWESAQYAKEDITVRGGDAVEVELWRTRHGPVVHGNPRDGFALSLRYTATDGPCRGFEVFRRMLDARTVEELFDTQRHWVDPVNNLVAADTEGAIGYLTRGQLPIRASRANRQFPAPGWTGEHEWIGIEPFERMPRSINPPEGFIATANQVVTAAQDMYIGATFAVPSRAERIVEVLGAHDQMTVEEIVALQGDTTSRPARAWSRLLGSMGPFAGDAEKARSMLTPWDGNLLPDSEAALLYGCFHRRIARTLFEPIVGSDVWSMLVSGVYPPTSGMIARWLANVVWLLDDTPSAPDGQIWTDVLPVVLAATWHDATEVGGPDPALWRWANIHRTYAQHTLAAAFPSHANLLNPPRVGVGGDADTVQAAAYGWRVGTPFDITNLSVYRQAIDLADIAHASFVIPGGISGLPRTDHYADQLESWRVHHRVPMWFLPHDVEAATLHRLQLTPA